jgi:hypothetical protein
MATTIQGRCSTLGTLTAAAEGTDGPVRVSRFGDVFTRAMDRKGLSLSGKHYVCTNPTFETGIAGHAAATATDDSKPFLTLQNTAAVTSQLKIQPLRLTLICTAAGTNGTDLRYTVHKSAAGVSRFTSGGSSAGSGGAGTLSAFCTSVSGATTSALIRAGAVVAPTDSNKVRVAGGLLRSVINVVQDMYIFDFGAENPGSTPAFAAATATATIVHRSIAPVTLEAQETMTFALIAASQSAAPSYELYLEYCEI